MNKIGNVAMPPLGFPFQDIGSGSQQAQMNQLQNLAAMQQGITSSQQAQQFGQYMMNQPMVTRPIDIEAHYAPKPKYPKRKKPPKKKVLKTDIKKLKGL